jgi:hypothetical protein
MQELKLSLRQFGLAGSSSPICELRVRRYAAGCIEHLHAALSTCDINAPIF